MKHRTMKEEITTSKCPQLRLQPKRGLQWELLNQAHLTLEKPGGERVEVVSYRALMKFTHASNRGPF